MADWKTKEARGYDELGLQNDYPGNAIRTEWKHQLLRRLAPLWNWTAKPVVTVARLFISFRFGRKFTSAHCQSVDVELANEVNFKNKWLQLGLLKCEYLWPKNESCVFSWLQLYTAASFFLGTGMTFQHPPCECLMLSLLDAIKCSTREFVNSFFRKYPRKGIISIGRNWRVEIRWQHTQGGLSFY